MKKALVWLLLAVSLVPIAYSNAVLFPLLSIKTLYLRGLVFAACCAFTWLLVTDAAYRAVMLDKLVQFSRSAIARTVGVSFVILGISTAFAFDRHMALLGTVERGEGLVGLAVFFVFFVLVSLVFDRKEWLRFFQLTLVSGLVLFAGELVQLAQGAVRPGSLVDNPIFLAAYLLFVMLSGYVVYREGVRTGASGWRFAGMASLCFAVCGIFITQSRGVMVGGGIGLVVALAYIGTKVRKQGQAGKKNARRVALVVAVLCALALLFGATRHSSVWQHVPGLSRIAQYSSSDATTKSRLINFEIAVHSVSPKHASLMRVGFGWGWDNYLYAWQQNYIPSIYAYDTSVFDRAHDKLLDMLVMNGIAGLVAYLCLWFFLFRALWQIGRRDPYLAAIGIFWAVAFFVQDLSAFDSIVTYISLYAVLSFAIYEKHT